ncbi:Adenylyltransferase and sulfurtransferase MOCS3 1 Molybdopterin-synthase adenylyltransferase Molybdopterin-synthase sulfurtransferase [Zea mays]|uniref:Adenylyltransferase and sulfurtransferase MOCS3 1 Molybdopterin-synthase adenylyltransferase Molybdopterin-synthase sulfurtransferase n=1 Tax=Zea mays TaxID=4577 RepID=A0A1D6NUB6_MAIZE|nr:Adenylyltransferase and sulfurtransferase MOCS3 1 Molybdopterin-synthase adenylyltransferase Molybdopterin-synthase sulfurtransferase [Zea mays]
MGGRREAIERELKKLRAEREELDGRIRLLESQLEAGPAGFNGAAAGKGVGDDACGGSGACQSRVGNEFAPDGSLPADMIYRYSRHLLLPDFGVEGQRKLSQSSILVVGAGGLGSPLALYLAACGVGRLGIVDGDDVELNNLHRQIIHKEAYVGQSKVKSAADACREINSSIKVVEYHHTLKPCNALEVARKYDIVVDATDNLPTRYMISDCCVLLNKPLVSGAALGLEGQLTVYHHNGSPCYRCLFPTPPPVAACQRCSDSGVLGVGRTVLIHLITMSTYNLQVKLRGSSPDCTHCGENSVFTEEDFQKFDYESFTQSPMSDKAAPSVNVLPESARITCREYKKLADDGEPHLLLDVRPAHHFQIASISPSHNIPLSMLEEKLPALEASLKEAGEGSALVVLCRRGNDSQRAVQLLREKGFASAKDIIGGLQAWGRDVDPDFPVY